MMTSETLRSEAGACGHAPFRAFSVALLLVVLVVLSPAANANTSIFTNSATCTLGWPNYCSSALSQFGLLSGQSGDTVTIGTSSANAGWTFNGGIGIRTGAELSSWGTANAANSIVDFADAVTSSTGNCSGAPNFCTNGGTWDGGSAPSGSQALVGTAETQLNNIVAKLLTYSGVTGTTITNSTLDFDTVGFNVETGGTGFKLYKATSYTPSGAIQLGCGANTCNANDLVLFYVPNGFSMNYSITLNDGLKSDQVIFFTPTGNIAFAAATANAITNIAGTFIAGSTGSNTNRTVTVGCTSTAGNGCDQLNLYGRIYDVNGGVTFNNLGGTQHDDGLIVGPTPEPGTWALMLTGLGLVVWRARRKTHVSAPRA